MSPEATKYLQLRNGDVYVGSTNDLRRRLESHQSGYVTSTKAHLPAALKTYIAVETEANARQLERYFKTGSGKAFANKRFWPIEPH
ncbi:GIY-YIG nuclease family protein [Mesorhizobium sp. M0488]|uniref:GIY-YIG nuclease family protein n=1 Tax=unclassified Mesorhizobium TaxID=325217 RepID=UPI00333CDD23